MNKISKFQASFVKKTLKIHDLQEADQYVEKAKKNISNHVFNIEWMKYTQKISTSSPLKTFFVLFSVLPALLSIVQSFTSDYQVNNCYEDNKTNSPLGLSQCLAYNSDSLIFPKSYLSTKQTHYYHQFITYSLTYYVLFYFQCYSFFHRNKYLVKMLGVGVKITQAFSKADLAIAFLFLVNVITVCVYRFLSHSFNVMRSFRNPNDGSIVNITFQISQTSGGDLIAGLELAIIFLCFASLVLNFYNDPISSFVTLKDFIDNAQSTGFDMSSLKYTVNDGTSLNIIKALFILYKKKEEETVILIAALEFFKAKDMVIGDEEANTEGTESRSNSDPLLIKIV